MKKKYYLNSIGYSLIFVLIVLFLVGFIVSCAFAFIDEMDLGTILVLVFLIISMVVLLFWIGFSFSMRIEIDYEKKEVLLEIHFFEKG